MVAWAIISVVLSGQAWEPELLVGVLGATSEPSLHLQGGWAGLVKSGDELKGVVVRALSLSRPGQVILRVRLKWDHGMPIPILLPYLIVCGDQVLANELQK